MPILGGVSGNCLASLTAIDQWIATLNSTTAGAARTGYKTSKITFGGGTTRLDRPSNGGALGIQFAEQALTVGSTNIDFTQGSIVASTEFTHVGLNGSQNAFFTVVDSIQSTVPGAATFGVPPATARFYFTRDGEFTRDRDGFLRTRDGLYVLGESRNNGATASRAMYIPTTDPNPEVTMSQLLDNGNLDVALAATANATTYNQKFLHTFVDDLQALRYSKYGGTVFETATPTYIPANFPAAPGGTAAGLTFRGSVAGSGSQSVKLNGSALEASNVQLPSTLVELSLAQKIYSALTKVIQTDQTKIDGILQLIR